MLPAPDFLAVAPFRVVPSLFHWRYSDGLLRGVCWFGMAVSAALLAGIPQAGPVWAAMLAWLVVWALYLSIVNIGQTFYAFGWETLLLEAGFIAVFLGPDWMTPPVTVIWAIRWLLFRLEVGAGLIKVRHDACWRDLTCLYYHHETQPMPNPLSWYFHRLPRPIHRLEVVGNHVGQLLAPFALFGPQPLAGAAGLLMVVLQVWLILSGNFAWLNVLTITLAFAAFDDRQLGLVLPIGHGDLADPPLWFAVVVLAFTVVVAVLSYWPVRNLLSRRQLMNASYNPLHLVNTYGVFGQITRDRYEVILEGTESPELSADTVWTAYDFKGKPGQPKRRPPQVAPYHLRLDWLMWFAALAPPTMHPWLVPLVSKLLVNDRPTLRLLLSNPFPDRPPTFIRASLYQYRFTGWRERKEIGAWWTRSRVGDYLPPLCLAPAPEPDRDRASPSG